APLTAVIDTGNTRHAHHKPISKRKMIFVIQNSGNPGHVMVINKIHEMFSPVKTPLLGPVLTLEGMSNFKHIHRVKAGVNAFITYLIGAAVEHVVIVDPVIVSYN